MFNTAVLRDLNSELAHVINHLFKSFIDVSFMIAEIYKNTKFTCLKSFVNVNVSLRLTFSLSIDINQYTIS